MPSVAKGFDNTLTVGTDKGLLPIRFRYKSTIIKKV